MKILGLSAFYGDSAAALVDDGRIVAAAQEERFTRKKRDSRFPREAMRFCLERGGIALAGLDGVVFHGRPILESGELTEIQPGPGGFASFRTPAELRELFGQDALHREFEEFDTARILCSNHHLSHAASAFFPSPFEEAVVLTMDSGTGEGTASSVAIGRGSGLAVVKEVPFPDSLGLLYSAFTHYTGFKVNSGEYKVMGLAPYGEPRYAALILEHLIDVGEDGWFRLDRSFFDPDAGPAMTNARFAALFGGPARRRDEPLAQRHMDLAASVQAVTEEVVLRITRALAEETGIANLCLAGGVALNCVANGKVLRDGAFKNLWIQPAAGDAGGALGAALAAYHVLHGKPRTVNRGDAMQGAYLGPEFAQADVERRLAAVGARYVVLGDAAVIERTAGALADGKAVGWHQGRMEFGPRALGARSVLADARSPTMQRMLNLKVKYRESFRPFAPSVLREDVAEWFEMEGDSPYMLLVADVAKPRRHAMTEREQALSGIDKLNIVRSEIPAVTHVDYSARVQTVHRETNPRYHALISRFKEKTGCPVIVNTSFNVRGEPIVCTPEDAFHCFMGTEIDVLVVGNCFLLKEDQDPALRKSYKDAFELD